MLPINIKAAQLLHEFKSSVRSWPGPTCSCHICIALLWLMLNFALHTAEEGCRCDGFVVAIVTVLLCLMYRLKRIYIYIYMPSFWRESTYWYLISLALRQNYRHSAADDIFECIFFIENLYILKNDRNFSKGLDTGLALFRRQTTV